MINRQQTTPIREPDSCFVFDRLSEGTPALQSKRSKRGLVCFLPQTNDHPRCDNLNLPAEEAGCAIGEPLLFA